MHHKKKMELGIRTGANRKERMTMRYIVLGLTAVSLALTACSARESEKEKQEQATTANRFLDMLMPQSVRHFMPADMRSLKDPHTGAMVSYLKARVAESRGQVERAAVYYDDAVGFDMSDSHLKEAAFATLLASGDVEKSLTVVKRMEGEQPVPPLANLLLSVQAVKEGNLLEAKRFLDQAQDVSPRLLHFQLMRAYMDIAEGRHTQDVVKELETFNSHDVLAPQKYYHVGRMLEQAGDMQGAKEAYVRSIEQDAASLFTVMRLGGIYEKEGQKETALALYERFVNNNPDSVLLDSTLKRMAEGRTPEKETFTVQENVAEVLFGFSALMVSQSMDMAGRQLMKMTQYLTPHYPFANFYLGIMEEQAGRPEQAIAHYSRIKPQEKTYLAAQVRIAEANFVQNNKLEAVNLLNGLAKKRPDLPLVTRALAEMYYDMNQYDKAISTFSQLLNSLEQPTSQHAILYFARGASYERTGKFDEASADLQKSLALQPNNPMVLNYLGYMWINRNTNVEEAFNYIKRAVLLKPYDGAIIDSLGWAYYKMGEYDKAVGYLERAVELEPNDATINAHLGDVYEKLARVNEARLQWTRAMKLGPESPEETARLRGKLMGTETADSAH